MIASETWKQFQNANGCRFEDRTDECPFSTASCTIDMFCAPHLDNDNLSGCPNIQYVFLESGRESDVTQFQRHRYSLIGKQVFFC